MSSEEITRVENFQRDLREQLQRLNQPKMVLEGDDECCEIRGNEAAFIQLAIDSLDVARRRDQAFVPPLSGRDIPMQIAALRFDPNPEPPVQLEQPWWGQIVVFAICGFIGIVFIAGLLRVLSWTEHMITGWFHH
jgi:hypothetical protein